MKKFSNFLFLLLALFLFDGCINGDDDSLHIVIDNPPNTPFSPCEDGEDIDISSLPQAIIDYIEDNYPNYTIDDAEQFFNDIRYGIQIELGDNEGEIELLFTENGVLISSGNDDDDISVSIEDLPASLIDYIEENYPGLNISESELELEYGFNYYEIHLGADIELYFSEDGTFLCDDENGNDDDDDGDDEDDDDGNDDDDDDGNDDDDDDDDGGVNPDNLPDEVLSFINASYSGYDIDDIEREDLCDGAVVYEVELEDGPGEDVVLYFALSGDFLFAATDITVDDLPDAVTMTINTDFAEYTIEEDDVEEFELADGSFQYEVELESESEDDITLIFDAEGNVICRDD